MASHSTTGGTSQQPETTSGIAELLAALSIEPDPHESLPSDEREASSHQWIAHGAHPVVQRILSKFPEGEELGKAAIQVIKLQLALRAMQVAADRALVLNEDGAEPGNLDLLSSKHKGKQKESSLFVQAAKSIASRFGQSPQSDRELLEELKVEHSSVIRRALAYWTRLPFPVMIELGPSTDVDIDEWIISNERFMRALLSVTASELSDSPSEDEPMWKSWLVKLDSPHAEALFGKPDVEAGCYTVERAMDLPGLCLLGRRRKASLPLRTIESFREHWSSMTGGVLDGLDWNNVCVAGGMVMGVLTGSFDATSIESYKDSDIDLYIYGLSPEEATAKLLHIEEVFKTNINKLYPQATSKPAASANADPPYAVLRNSKTITLIPHYPFRRVQIILKICASPMETLLNFDLDQAAMGFDGTGVWMLPRAARALVTGYTTFTMDLVQGHYLNDRRATQDERLFKYASRGFGIRFLESYLDAVKDMKQSKVLNDSWERDSASSEATASGYSESDESSDKDGKEDKASFSLLHTLLNDARSKVDWFVKAGVAHSDIDSRDQVDAQLGRGCLANFENFAKHVALAELQLDGVTEIAQRFSAQAYDEDPGAYYDGPDYTWDDKFTLLGLRDSVKLHGHEDVHRLFDALREIEYSFDGDFVPELNEPAGMQHPDPNRLAVRPWLQRVTWSTSVQDALKEKLVSAVYAPDSFIQFARAVLPSSDTQLQNALKEPQSTGDSHYSFVYWENDFAWQLVDRLRDEVNEMLHAFRRAYANYHHDHEKCERDAIRQISRRAPRPTREAEINAFRAWAGRPNPEYTSGYQNGEEWQMLQMPRDLTAQRFSLSVPSLMALTEDHELWIGDEAEEVEAWWRASIRRSKGLPLPYPTGETNVGTAQSSAAEGGEA